MNKCCVNGSEVLCKILDIKECMGENCSFFKTAKQQKADRAKAYLHIASLGYLKQRNIADKYYGGKMPWLKGGADNDC